MICLLLVFATSGCPASIAAANPADTMQSPNAIYNVMKFGAKGNGLSDDGPSIQKALNAAAAAGGGNVTFPCGEFALLSVAGAAPSGRSILYLRAATQIQVTGKGSCSHIFTALPQKSVFEFDSSAQISFNQLRLTALNAKYVETYGMDGGSAVRFTGVNKGSIQHVEVDGASAGALYLTAGTSNVSVANNFVHDTYGAGIWEDDCSGANAHDCMPSKPAANNLYDSNTLTNTTLAALSAINLDDGNGSAHAIIRNNTISWTRAPRPGNNQVQCIQVNNASDVSVINNSCSGTPWNGIVITTGPDGSCRNITVQGNIILDSGSAPSGGSAIAIYDAPQGKGISAFTLSDNRISKAANHGISVFSAKRGNIHDGQLRNNTITLIDQRSPGSSFGIDVESSAAIIVSGNTISCDGKCAAAGINIAASTATTPKATDNQTSHLLGQPLVIR